MKNLFLQIKRVFSKLTPLEVITAELAEAELSLLEHQTAVEFSQAIVEYNQHRMNVFVSW